MQAGLIGEIALLRGSRDATVAGPPRLDERSEPRLVTLRRRSRRGGPKPRRPYRRRVAQAAPHAGHPGAVTGVADPPQRGMATVLRGGATYIVAATAQRLALFVLLPFFARAMSPSEYGTLGVALSINLFATVVFSFGLELPIVRTYFRLAADPYEQRRAMATLGAFLLVAPAISAIVLSGGDVALGAPLIPARYTIVALLDAAFTVAAATFPLALLRAEDRLRDYLLVTSILAITTSVLTAVFVLRFRWGALGWLGAIAAGDGVTLVVAALRLPWPRPRNLSRRHLVSSIRLGLPLLPHLMSQWALQFSDRAILVVLVSRAEVGAYSLAINISVPVLVATAAIGQAVSPSYGRALLNTEARRRLAGTVRLQVLIIAVMTGAVALLGPVLVAALIPRTYAAAGDLIPWIALGYAVWGLSGLPMNGLSFLAGRTMWIWPISLLAAGIKVIGLLLLVPSYGLISAAIMYPVANGVLLVGVSILAAKTPRAHVAYDRGRMGAAICVALLVVVPVTVFASTSTTAGVVARLCAVILLPVLLYLSPGLTKAERRAALPARLAR